MLAIANEGSRGALARACHNGRNEAATPAVSRPRPWNAGFCFLHLSRLFRHSGNVVAGFPRRAHALFFSAVQVRGGARRVASEHIARSRREPPRIYACFGSREL